MSQPKGGMKQLTIHCVVAQPMMAPGDITSHLPLPNQPDTICQANKAREKTAVYNTHISTIH